MWVASERTGPRASRRTPHGGLRGGLLYLVAAAACGGGSGTESPPPPPQLVAINFSRSADTIVQIINDTIDVFLQYQSTRALEADVRLTSDNPSIVRLDTTIKASRGSASLFVPRDHTWHGQHYRGGRLAAGSARSHGPAARHRWGRHHAPIRATRRG